MNRILHFLLTVCLLFNAQKSLSQITMNSMYTPYINDNYNYKVVNDTSIQPGAAGAAVNWNFTGITLSVSGSVESFVNPGVTPFASSFPTAGLACNDLVNGYDYFSTSASGIEFKGCESSIGGSLILSVSNSQDIITYPFTYGSSVTNAIVTGTDNFGDTLSGTITSVGDAWGVLALPLTSFLNVVRVKTVYDLVALYGPGTETYYTTVIYAWYGSGSKLPLMKIITYDVNHGAGYHSKIIRVGNFLTTGLNNVENIFSGLNVIPNPVQAQTTVSFSLKEKSDVTCCLYDGLGRLIISRSLNGLSSGLHSEMLDLSDLKKGIYYLLIDANGLLNSRKISIE